MRYLGGSMGYEEDKKCQGILCVAIFEDIFKIRSIHVKKYKKFIDPGIILKIFIFFYFYKL
jgi:hypothetical protein